jgi:hypothetical protein
MRTAAVLCALLPLGQALALALSPPGVLFNLSSWGLQLPLSNGKGGVTQVLQPALKTYTSAYFYTDPADNGMTFWCPENGATTGGSSFPRSELREEFDFDLSPGRHVLNATVAVLSANSSKASVTIGQAHVDGISGHCSIFVELMWTDGTVTAHLRDKSCNNVNVIVGTDCACSPLPILDSLGAPGDFPSAPRSPPLPHTLQHTLTHPPAALPPGPRQTNSATL